MQCQPEDDDHTEGHHVLRSPLYALRLVYNAIAVVASCLTILIGQDERIDDMHDEEEGQAHRPNKRIPIRPEEFTDSVVTLL